MDEELFREDAYLKHCEANCIGVNDRGGIVLDRTVFYATGGGQPGDSGVLTYDDGKIITITTTVYDADRSTIVHVPTEDSTPPICGESVTCELDWERRYAHMRVHTCLHLLCSLIPYPVTGGQIDNGKGRLDFDIPDSILDKTDLTNKLNQLINDDRPVLAKWISDDELLAEPDLVRTMAVKPPMGTGRVRLIEIENCDIQPCGGTHVKSTVEIGQAEVTKIEKKGAQNRRVRITLI